MYGAPVATRSVNRSIAAYEELRAGILDGRWAPDDHLSTYRLATELGMSRTPVSEALKRLEADGLIAIVPQVGCRVLPAAGDPRETFLIRAALEGIAAEVAASRIGDAELRALAAGLRAAEAAVAAADAMAFASADREFHVGLVRAAGLAHVERVLFGVWTLHRLQVARHGGHARWMAASSDEHRRILRALRDRDAVGARVAVEEHLRRCERDHRGDTAR